MNREKYNSNLEKLELKKIVPKHLNEEGNVFKDIVPYHFTSGYTQSLDKNGVPNKTEYCYLPIEKYKCSYFYTDEYGNILTIQEANLLFSYGIIIVKYNRVNELSEKLALYISNKIHYMKLESDIASLYYGKGKGLLL